LSIAVFSTVTIFGLWIYNWQLLVERKQLRIALSIHEEFDGVLLEAEGEIFKLLKRDLVVILKQYFSDSLNVVNCCKFRTRHLVHEFLPLYQDLAWVKICKLFCVCSSAIAGIRGLEGTRCPIFGVELAVASFSLVFRDSLSIRILTVLRSGLLE